MNTAELVQIIANRRTMKPERFSDEQISEEELYELFEAANWAPTHGYTEPWRFVVHGTESKIRLADFLNGLESKMTGEENPVRAQKRLSGFEKCAFVISIVMKRGSNPKIPELEELLSVAMAVQNFWLVAHQKGLAGYWSTGPIAFRDELREYLGFDEGDKSLGFFFLGKPSVEPLMGRRLSPWQEKVRFEK